MSVDKDRKNSYRRGGKKVSRRSGSGSGYTGGEMSGGRDSFLEEVPGYSLVDAANRIMKVENSKANPFGGYDAVTGRWYPHRSYEGGADTIGYGIKMSNGSPEAELARSQGYLTDAQAIDAVGSLVRRYDESARRKYDKINGEGAYDSLGEKARGIVIDYEYNPGIQKFPSLMKAFHNEDYKGIRDNYKRYSGGKPLGRNKVLLKDIDSLGVFYPIHSESGGGKIHIKPSHRGKLTELKKRTGKTEAELYNDGNPAHKKMVVFARNSRKWKHSDGGYINQAINEGKIDILLAAINNVKNQKIR